MESFTKVTGIAAALPMINIDTDMIIPKQYLKTTKRTGLGVGLLSELRFDDTGQSKPDFILNKPPFDHAKILITGENFGCGSSREHAPWALKDFGIVCVIAPSFADIFYNNCFQNALLPIILPEATVKDLMRQSSLGDNATFCIDLECQVIHAPEGEVSFHLDEKKRHALLNGLDAIGETLAHSHDIDVYERQAHEARPWL